MPTEEQDILTRFLTGMNPVPGANVSVPPGMVNNAQPPVREPGFFKQMLAGFVTNLAQTMKSGAFQKGVASGIATRKRGSKPSDAFAAALGGVSEEQERIESTNALRRIQDMRAKLEQDDSRLKTERLALDREREQRIAAMQKENLKATLAKAGLRQTVDAVTGEPSLEPIPEQELPLDVQQKIASNRSLQEYRNVRLEMDRTRMELGRERNEIARNNYSARIAELGIKKARLEAELFGTVAGEPLAGGPTDESGQPIGLGVFRATKPTLAEGQAAASIATSQGTVETLKTKVIPSLRAAIENGDIEGFIVEQRALRQQLGLLANISRGIGGERGAQTEQDIRRAEALLPSVTDVLKDFATAGRTTQRVIQEIEAIVQRNTDILSRVPGVRRILDDNRKSVPSSGTSTIPPTWKRIQ